MKLDNVAIIRKDNGQNFVSVIESGVCTERYRLPFLAMDKPVTGKEISFKKFARDTSRVRGWVKMENGCLSYCRRLSLQPNVILIHNNKSVDAVEFRADWSERERRVVTVS